jgi:mono/diheme cytochrome c family protein
MAGKCVVVVALSARAKGQPDSMSDHTKHSGDAMPSTRRGDYRPAAPEASSATERWVLRVELTAMILIVAAISARFYQINKPDRTPVKVAGFHSAGALKALPPGFEALASDGFSSDAGDAGKGQVLYAQSCTTCHGQNLQGMPHQGVNLRESKFVASTNDRKLIAFLKLGRKPADPGNQTGLLMPPRGGNPSLDDDALGHIVAFLRQVQHETSRAAGAETPTTKPVASVEP